MQTQQTEIAGQKAVQELAAAKKTYLQKIVSWKLPEAQARDVVFIVHTQLRRKQRRFQAFYVSHCLKICTRCGVVCVCVLKFVDLKASAANSGA